MSDHPEHCVFVNTYGEFRDDIHKFADGKYRFILVIGNNGIGKTETVVEMLGKRNCLILEGSPTAWGAYCQLYDHRNCTVTVFDDIDPRFYRDPKCNAFLKALTETKKEKTVRWPTASTGKDRQYPSSFTTTTRVIAITNRWDSINEHVRAIEGRAFSIVFEPTPTELHLEVGRRGWFNDQEVYDFIWQHKHLITRPNMRLYKKIEEQKNAGARWQTRGLEMIHGNGRLREVFQILRDPTYTSNNERAKAFIDQGFGSRSLFYELLREFRYYKSEDSTTGCPLLSDLHREQLQNPRISGHGTDVQIQDTRRSAK